MEFEKTRTAENLRKALTGESIARNKYTYFAIAARANGDEDVAQAFEQMAKNEMMHAKFWFEQLYGKPNDTLECLVQAAQGEYEEWHGMYPEFAQQAREEGLEQIAIMFEKVAAIERSHENRFMTLMAQLSRKNQKTPVKERVETRMKKVGYRCHFCGAISEQRPDICNVCEAIGSFDAIEYYE